MNLTKEIIRQCINPSGSINRQKLKKYNINLSTQVLYNFFYDINTPLCSNPNCKNFNKKELKFISFSKGYNKYCSISCSHLTDDYKNKIKQTCLEKYGVEHYSQSSQYNEKVKQTCLEKYGVESSNQYKEIKDKKKQTCLEKYGVEHPFQSKEVQEKYKETCLEKYGTYYPIQNKEVQEKSKQTCLENYGVEHPIQNKKVQEKYKETCLEKYGCKYPMQNKMQQEKSKQTCLEKYGTYYSFQNKEVQNKIKQTCLENYGVEHPIQNKKVQEKYKETCLEKYGTYYPIQNKEVQDKYKETCLEKYGVNHYFKTEEFKDKVKQSYLEKYGVEHPTLSHITNYENFNEKYLLENFVEDNLFDVEKAMEYFNVSYNMFAKTKCKFELPPFKTNKGKTQQEIYNLISNSLLNDRTFIKPLEIDIINHEFKFGIEYDGLLFHSYGKSKYRIFDNFEMEDKNYHLNKTKLVEDKEYQLFHIFENEWLDENKREIWISILNSKMNNTNRIYARKTEIREVSNSESKTFLDNNHLQGSSNSSINFGLFYKNELVSLMTFGKARFSKQYEYELLRFCNKLNTTVIGGFSKLLRHFEQTYNPKSLVSYANRRWSQGNVYEKNGFVFSHNSSPNYFYFKDSMLLESRNKYQKHKLHKLLENFNSELNEKDNMFNHGYRRIWDSGNKVYYKIY